MALLALGLSGVEVSNRTLEECIGGGEASG
jgi:hypothetical protein